VVHVEVLLEVVLEREVDKWPLARGQFHRGGESALDDCDVACRQGDLHAITAVSPPERS
jgi:hypothetical protein